MWRSTLLLILLQVLPVARPACASVIRIEFDGIFTSKADDFDLLQQVSVGDRFSGFYTYDDSVAGGPSVSGTDTTVYPLQNLDTTSIRFASEGDTFVFAGTFPPALSEIRIFDGAQFLAGQQYQFVWADQLDSLLTVNGLTITAANVFYGNPNDPRNNRFITSEELTAIPDFGAAGYLSLNMTVRQERLEFTPPTGTSSLVGTITSLRAVPEPRLSVTLLGALGALFFRATHGRHRAVGRVAGSVRA